MKHTNQIDFPLVFFSLAFFIILFGLFSRFSFQPKKYVEPKMQKVSSIPDSDKKQTVSLNYSLPIICEYQIKSSSISAAMSGNDVSFTAVQNAVQKNYTLAGDCLFSWNTVEKTGKKQCGVGQYVSIAKQLLGSGLASVDSLGEMAKQSGKNIPFDMGSLLKTCKNVKEVKKEVFIVPKNVVFK